MTRLITAVLVASAGSITPAAAEGFYLYWNDGTATYVPLELLLICGLVMLGGCVIGILLLDDSSARSSATGYELTAPDTTEYYEDQAARYRAMKRELDAQIELTESYINARRARAELDELPEILSYDKAKRRR